MKFGVSFNCYVDVDEDNLYETAIGGAEERETIDYVSDNQHLLVNYILKELEVELDESIDFKFTTRHKLKNKKVYDLGDEIVGVFTSDFLGDMAVLFRNPNETTQVIK